MTDLDDKMPVGDYPGVVYDQERDVMQEGTTTNIKDSNEVYEPVTPVDDAALRAAALQTATMLGGDGTVTTLLLNAAAIEAYLRGQNPSGLLLDPGTA